MAIQDLIDQPHIMLTGAELLAKVKDQGDAYKSDLVRSCGYVSTKKVGTERLNFTAFYEALLEAKGMNLGPGGGRGGKGRPGGSSAMPPRCSSTATCSSARPTPPSWARSPAMSSRSSWDASRSSSSPWALLRRSEIIVPMLGPELELWLA
jgi:hypothetical protein